MLVATVVLGFLKPVSSTTNAVVAVAYPAVKAPSMTTCYGLVAVKSQVGEVVVPAIVIVHADNEAAYTSVGKTILRYPPLLIVV